MKHLINKDKNLITFWLTKPIFNWTTPADEFQRAMLVAEMDGVKEMRMRINCPGGAIDVGSAIANEIERSSMRTIAMVDGIAASMASNLLAYFDEVEIAGNAKIMIHNPSGYASGQSDDMRTAAQLLDDMKNDLLDRYVKRTNVKRKALSTMMDQETWINAKQAIKNKFADRVYNAVAEVETDKSAPDDMYTAFHSKLTKFYNLGDDPTKIQQMYSNEAKLKLGLPTTATDAQVEQALTNLQTQAAKTEALEKQINDQKASQVNNLINKAIADEKITADSKDHYTKLATGDFETTKAILDGMTKVVKPSDVINSDVVPGQAAEKKWDELVAMGPEKFTEWKDQNPEAYQKAFKDHYK